MAEPDDTLPPPLNMGESIEEMHVLDANCLAIDADTRNVGILTILTPIGHCDFVITVETANLLVQKLRDFLRDEVDDLLEGPTS